MSEIEDLRSEIERLYEEATDGILENAELENSIKTAVERNKLYRKEIDRLREALGDICNTAGAALEK